MSVKVIDLNEEAKEEQPVIETIEEEPKKTEPVVDTSNEIIEKEAPVETIEETKEAPEHEVSCSIREPEPKPKPKAKPKASDIVNCEKCNKSMTYKNLRYSHKCYEEPQAVKPHVKPKAKQKPKPAKPPPEVYYSDDELSPSSGLRRDDEVPQTPVSTRVVSTSHFTAP